MSPELAEIAAGWPVAASLAAGVGAGGLLAGRRRTALNEALHELRRPLQALTLVPPGARAEERPEVNWSVQMAAAALERLDREINGRTAAPIRAPLRARPLLESAVGRWKGRAALAGGSLGLRWEAADATINGDRCEISQALDNLIVNALEHGGPDVVVAVVADSDVLRLSVIDAGRSARPSSRLESPVEVIARLSGRRRRGHGLRVVRRIAAAHGGDFRLRCSELGTEATLELPLLGGVR
jgi:signal transduction histidine kinase